MYICVYIYTFTYYIQFAIKVPYGQYAYIFLYIIHEMQFVGTFDKGRPNQAVKCLNDPSIIGWVNANKYYY